MVECTGRSGGEASSPSGDRGRSDFAESLPQQLSPRFQVFDQFLLLLDLGDQDRPVHIVPRGIPAFAHPLSQVGCGLPQLREILFHEAELFAQLL